MEMIVVKSKVKEVANQLNVGGDLVSELNNFAIEEVNKAVKRCMANGRKTVQAKDVWTGELNKEMVMLVVKSKLKEVANGCNVSSDFALGLNEVVMAKVIEAGFRAEANGRKTIGARDL